MDNDETSLPAGPGRAFMATSMPEPDVAERTPALEPGSLVGVWRIVALLGAGGMGEVYRAERDDGLYAQTVALKLIRGRNPEQVRRFELERQRLAEMDHPGVSRIIDGGTAPDGRPFMAMEFVEGEQIDDWIRRQRPARNQVIRIVEALCAAVAHAHARLVLHQDIKPANVLVGRDSQPRLIDFGIAALLDAAQAPGSTALTVTYAAPEQLRGEALSVAVDVFALGLLLHQLLVGALPARRPDGGVVIEAAVVADADLAAILARATAFAPADRYPAVDALAEDLRAWRERRPVSARAGGSTYRLGRFLRRYPVQSGLAAAVVLALAGGLAASLKFAADARAESERTRVALEEAQWQYELANNMLLGMSAYADLLRGAFGGDEGSQALRDKLMTIWRERHAAWEASPEPTAALSFAVARNFYFRRDHATAHEVFGAWLDAGYGPKPLLDAGLELYAMSLFDSGQREAALPRLRDIYARMQTGPRRSAVDKFNVVMRIANSTRAPADIATAEALYAERVEETRGLQAEPEEQIESLAARLQLARMRSNHEESANALRAMLAVYEANPEAPPINRALVRANLAELLLFAQQDFSATESIARAIVTEDVARTGESAVTARGHYLLSRALAEQRRYDEAEQALRRSIALNATYAGGRAEGSADENLALAVILAGRGDVAGARAILAAVEALANQPPLARLRLAFTSAYVDAMTGAAPAKALPQLEAELTPEVANDLKLGFMRARLAARVAAAADR
jgi:eukaryotic-like serine/threonine-protein kinase